MRGPSRGAAVPAGRLPPARLIMEPMAAMEKAPLATPSPKTVALNGHAGPMKPAATRPSSITADTRQPPICQARSDPKRRPSRPRPASVAASSASASTSAPAVNAVTLGQITDQSGGRTRIVHDTSEVSAALAQFAEELNSQYLIGYASSRPSDGRFHSIRVHVKGAVVTDAEDDERSSHVAGMAIGRARLFVVHSKLTGRRHEIEGSAALVYPLPGLAATTDSFKAQHTVGERIADVSAVTLAPGERPVLGYVDGHVAPLGGEPGAAFKSGAGWVTALDVSPDGQLLASAHADGFVYVWRLGTAR